MNNSGGLHSIIILSRLFIKKIKISFFASAQSTFQKFLKFFIILKINLFFLTTSQMYLLHLMVGEIRNEVHVRT